MLVKQVSAFIENKAGRLNEIADVLANSNIDILNFAVKIIDFKRLRIVDNTLDIVSIS